eukprot:GCRY01001093.1.p1 GENE.GCRY01001093.1~~GCRY01001093.1.p1  ORF type:complete len:129 (+),score=21.50 GCRY01001093.1:128-514(+)
MKTAKESVITLTVLLQAMRGEVVQVELFNNKMVEGTVDSADEDMNLFLINGKIGGKGGDTFTFDQMFIRGQNIRYVNIPSHINAVAVIDKHLAAKVVPKREPKKRPASIATIVTPKQSPAKRLREDGP